MKMLADVPESDVLRAYRNLVPCEQSSLWALIQIVLAQCAGCTSRTPIEARRSTRILRWRFSRENPSN